MRTTHSGFLFVRTFLERTNTRRSCEAAKVGYEENDL